MGKKRFIDKKNSATFHLLARDSSNNHPTAADPVFVRVDNNPFSTPHWFSSQEDDDFARAPDSAVFGGDDSASIFADAPDDVDSDEEAARTNPPPPPRSGLPEHVRREILELGLPDDGYNYLLHLREINNAGGGSSYYHNRKAKLDQVPIDVKAFDASRVSIRSSDVEEEALLRRSMYCLSEAAVGVRVQKVVDLDVAALLDETDSRFGSDVDDLEEDFVIKANLSDQVEGAVDEATYKPLSGREEHGECSSHAREVQLNLGGDEWATEKPRVRRLLDEQFDLLALKEYDNDHGYDDENHYDSGDFEKEDEPLSSKLNDSVKNFLNEELEYKNGYKARGEFSNADEITSQLEEEPSHAEVIQKCREYAEIYSQEKEDVVELLEESSDDSEEWDCETIVSTYSNLDNHPGRIESPQMRKKKHVTIADIPTGGNSVISLHGREKLPVEFLPHSRRNSLVKVERNVKSGAEQLRKKSRSAETKEEKKERKAAVKEERREARIAKKNLKGVYRCEAQRAQKVAATTGPCSVHLM